MRSVRRIHNLRPLADIPALIKSKWAAFLFNEQSGAVAVDSAAAFNNNDGTPWFPAGVTLTGSTANAWSDVGFINTTGTDFEIFLDSAPFDAAFDIKAKYLSGSGHIIFAYGGKFAQPTSNETVFSIQVGARIRHASNGTGRISFVFRTEPSSEYIVFTDDSPINPFDGTYHHILFDLDFNTRIISRYIDGGIVTAPMPTQPLLQSGSGAALLGRRIGATITQNIGSFSAASQVGYFYAFSVDGNVSSSIPEIAANLMRNSGELPYEAEVL